MNELLNLYQTHQGKVTDRWLAYLHQYERLFVPWRERPLRLLEIGIQNGGSLEIWGRYFPAATVLVGCDIDPLCERLTYDDPRISVVVGDASSDETDRRIEAISPQWDIVIEDGSHQSRHIVDAFARYFPRVVEGGLFIAEDLPWVPTGWPAGSAPCADSARTRPESPLLATGCVSHSREQDGTGL